MDRRTAGFWVWLSVLKVECLSEQWNVQIPHTCGHLNRQQCFWSRRRSAWTSSEAHVCVILSFVLLHGWLKHRPLSLPFSFKSAALPLTTAKDAQLMCLHRKNALVYRQPYCCSKYFRKHPVILIRIHATVMFAFIPRTWSWPFKVCITKMGHLFSVLFCLLIQVCILCYSSAFK